MANIEIADEVQTAIDNGARGVGMYRTEFLYLNYRLPTEEEQLASYARIAQALAPHPVIVRTIDLGGDKLSHVLDTTPEANPFLGWRGIRICLDAPELFKTQLRALLRAGAQGEVRILLPMISTIDELRQARALLEEAGQELGRAGQEFRQDCPLGVMVEVPSVALMAELFAQEADFLSLGTNDLTQYTLAVDRGTSSVAELFDPFHPAVLRLVKMVAESGARHQVPVSICGEMAGDPLATVLLLGLGLECLSMSPGLIPQVKEVVRAVAVDQAQRMAEECLKMQTGAQVRAYLEEVVGEYLPFWQRHGHG
jgi:phosphotransferase system enzyme I (PtsI)